MVTYSKKHDYYNHNFFARWAWLYDYEKYITFPLRRRAARFLDLAPPKKLIDIATGTGSQAYELAKLGHDVLGVDLSPEMLEQAKKKLQDSLLKLRFLHTDATELPFKDNAYDGASISLGLHDMPYEIGLKVLSEIKRVVKRNGPVLIVDYMEPRKHWVAKMSHPLISLYETLNYNPFIEKGLDAILDEVELKVDTETHFLGLFQIVIVKNIKP